MDDNDQRNAIRSMGLTGVDFNKTSRLWRHIDQEGMERAIYPECCYLYTFTEYGDPTVYQQFLVLRDESVNPFMVQHSFGPFITSSGFRHFTCNECPDAPLRPANRPVIAPDDWNDVECARSLNF